MAETNKKEANGIFRAKDLPCQHAASPLMKGRNQVEDCPRTLSGDLKAPVDAKEPPLLVRNTTSTFEASIFFDGVVSQNVLLPSLGNYREASLPRFRRSRKRSIPSELFVETAAVGMISPSLKQRKTSIQIFD